MVEDINAYNELKDKVTKLFSEVVVADRRVVGQEGVIIGERMTHQFPWNERNQMLLSHPGFVLGGETNLIVPNYPPGFDKSMVLSLMVDGVLTTGRRFFLAGRFDTYITEGYRDCVMEQAENFGGIQRLGVIVDGKGEIYTDSPFFSSAPRINNIPSYMAMLQESQTLLGFLHSYLLYQAKPYEDSTRTN